MDITRFGHFADAELNELRTALNTHISELEWHGNDSQAAHQLRDELDDERGARFNAAVED